MLTPFRRSIGAALFALLTTVACGGEDAITATPTGTGPLPWGTWHMHSANGEDLPAPISERYIGVVFEEIFVDSAQLSLDPFTRTYFQRYWVRVNHNGVLDRTDYVYDQGAFEPVTGTYEFTSETRSRTFTVSSPSASQIESVETMVFFAAGSPPVAGIYRLTRP